MRHISGSQLHKGQEMPVVLRVWNVRKELDHMKVDVEERLKEDQTKQSNMHLGYATPRANGVG